MKSGGGNASNDHTEGLLLEGEENRVDEFNVLEVVVDHVVELESLQHC